MITEAYVPTALALPIPQQMVMGLTVSSPDLPADRQAEKEFLTIQAGTVLPSDPTLELGHDIYASIDRDKDGFVIASVIPDEEGYGWTYEEAWRDFLSSLKDRRDSLARRETRLAPSELKILQHLRSLLKQRS